MKIIWIIGAGRFGSIAAKRLSRQHSSWQFLMIDPVMENLSELKKSNIALEQADGIKFLYHNLKPETEVSWIIPCLPVHMAYEWCCMKMGYDHLVRTKPSLQLDSLLPNPLHGPSGDIYVSNADFICPDNCSEPEELCTVTKLPRKMDMYHRLETLQYKDYLPIVLQSRQLAPGVGGVTPEQLFSFWKKAEQNRGPFLLCTACRCHGVITPAERIS